MRQLVLDIRTTGLDGWQDRIVEIAAVELIDHRCTGVVFHHFFNPDWPIHPGLADAERLSQEFLRAQPRFHEMAPRFLEFARGAEILIHNAQFDLWFIYAELSRAGYPSLSSVSAGIVDTLAVARQLHPTEHNNLAALYARYGKAQADDRSSGALRDAMQLSEVYLASFASLRLERAVAGSSIWCPDMERELFMYLRDDPERVFDLTPRRFEELVAAIFRNNGFAVELGPQTRDGGVDIIAVEHSALTGIGVHLIECKRYHRSKTVGIGVVQRLIGAVTQRRATKGIVVATSSFTRDAVRVAEETRHLIALNDYTSIVGWLDSLGRPGRALV